MHPVLPIRRIDLILDSDDESTDESTPDDLEVKPTAKELSILGTLMTSRSSYDASPGALIRHGMSDSESDDKSADESARPSDDVQPTAKQLQIATLTSAWPFDYDPTEVRSPTALALEEAPVVSRRQSTSDERPAVVATVVPLAPSATPATRSVSVSGRAAHRTAAPPPPPADNSNRPQDPICAAEPPSPCASALLAQSTTHPASASGGGADGPQRAAAAAEASLPLAEPAVAAAAVLRAQLREMRRRLKDEE